MGCDFVMFRLFFGRGDRSKTWQIFKQSWCRNTTLLGTNMYHLWKRNIIFQNYFKTGFLHKQNVSFVPLNHFGDFGWEGYFPVTEDLPLALAVLHFFLNSHQLVFCHEVYFGVGTYGTADDKQRGLGACYRLKVGGALGVATTTSNTQLVYGVPSSRCKWM